MSQQAGDRAQTLKRLIDQVDRLVRESGRPQGFDVAAWLIDWIEHPVPALGNRRPLDLLDPEGGEQLVSQILSRMQSGPYS